EPEENKHELMRAVHDRYRCPERFLHFRISSDLQLQPEYFQFGPGVTCYGRAVSNASQSLSDAALCDVLPNVSIDHSRLILPFDPKEKIDNLRLEKYPGCQMSKPVRASKRFYYRLRPLTSRFMRKGVQQLRASNWEKRQFPQWPVDTAVESICE